MLNKKWGVTRIVTQDNELLFFSDDEIWRGTPSGVVFIPVDSKAMVPAVRKMNAAGIPIVNIVDHSLGGEILSWIGADEYVTKPFSTRELEQTVARLLRERQDAGHGPAGGVLAECRRRRDKGDACQIVVLDWDARAMDIFRKKYGEFKYHEAQRALRNETEKFLKEIKEPGPIDLHETSGVSLLVKGAPPGALRRAQDLARRLDALAATFYGPDDRTRGFITFRDPRTEQAPEQKFPLLTFTPHIAPDDLAA